MRQLFPRKVSLHGCVFVCVKKDVVLHNERTKSNFECMYMLSAHIIVWCDVNAMYVHNYCCVCCKRNKRAEIFPCLSNVPPKGRNAVSKMLPV